MSIARTYAHMCRDGHVEIGHSDSEHEQCPLCRAMSVLQKIAERGEGTWPDLTGKDAEDMVADAKDALRSIA